MSEKAEKREHLNQIGLKPEFERQVYLFQTRFYLLAFNESRYTIYL